MSNPGITRRRVTAAMAAFLLALTPAVTATPAMGAALPLSGFVVASDGRIYRAPGPGGSSLTLASSAVVAPPGAAISTVRQSNGNFALLFIGTHGGLIAATPSATGSGLNFVSIGSGGLAAAGGHISTVTAPDGVHAFFPGLNGAIYVISFGGDVKPGPVPWQVSQAGLVPPTASIAAGWDSTGLGAAFIGVNGALYSIWRGSPGWTTARISSTPVAPPGGGVAVLSGGDQKQVFYAGNDATVWQVVLGPYPHPWQPQAISAAGAIAPGAQLVVVPFGPRPEPWLTAGVFFAAPNGAVTVVADLGSGWLAPVPITPPGIARPAAALAVAWDLDDPILSVAWCGNDPVWWWLQWRKPSPPPPWPSQLFSLRPYSSFASLQPGANVSAALWRY